jgi:hypothetical protein
MSRSTTQELANLAGKYIANRDNFVRLYRDRASGFIALSAGGPLAFNEMINGHCAELVRIMPAMTLEQWEGLSELASAQLNRLRLQISEDSKRVQVGSPKD